MSQQLFTRAVIEKALSERPWVYRKGNKYRVVPRSLGHGKYELEVSWNGDVPEVTDCRDYRTGEGCKGFTYSKACYHSASLAFHLLKRKIRGHAEKNVIVFPQARIAHRSGVAGS